jgi:hypothetical protein
MSVVLDEHCPYSSFKPVHEDDSPTEVPCNGHTRMYFLQCSQM